MLVLPVKTAMSVSRKIRDSSALQASIAVVALNTRGPIALLKKVKFAALVIIVNLGHY
jgi:hypothetical protein